MKRNLKAVIALLLMVCVMSGFVPEPFTATVAESLQAHAEELEGSLDRRPVSGEMESGGWLYRICADGYAVLTGYTDTSATSLTFPAALGGAWVVRVADNAFADNTLVSDVTIPAQINEISATAFPNNSQMTVHAYNGTAALEFASDRCFRQDNKSEYDLFDDVLDLSDMKSSQWSMSGQSMTMAAPYMRLMYAGAKVYLPEKAEFVNGLPVEIVSLDAAGGTAVFSELSFAEAVESFRAEDVRMTPDLENIQILAEGVEFDPSAAKSVITVSGSVPLNFNVNWKIDGARSISGTVGYTTGVSVSVDYDNFKINEFSYTNQATAFTSVTYKYKGKLIDEKMPTKSLCFARVPMISATVIKVWLDLSFEISVEGEVTIKGEISTTEKFTMKDGKMTKSKSVSNKPPVLSVAVGLDAGVKGAIVVRIGFVAIGTYIEVAELAVSYGWKAVAKVSAAAPDCVDLSLSRYFKVSVRIGLLKAEVASQKIKVSMAFGGDVFNVTKKILEAHFEFPTLKFVDSCTLSIYATAKYYAGENDTGVTYATVTVEKGELLPRPSDPTRAGYTFGGWYKDIYFAQPWDFDTERIEKNITLYAKWTNDATGMVETPNPDDFGDGDPASDPARLLTAEESLPYLTYEVGDFGVTITGYNGSPIALTIPNEIEGSPVVAIAQQAFRLCLSLRQIVLPDSIVTMGAWAFMDTNITEIRTPASWTEVTYGYGSDYLTSPFAGCRTLKRVIVPEGAAVLPDYAFSGRSSDDCPTSSITSVSLPGTLESIGVSAFVGTGISSIDLPEGLTTIGNQAFLDCAKLTSISLPDSITTMGAWAFKGTGITSVRTPVNWTSVTYGYGSDYLTSPFAGCTKLTRVYVPEGATMLPDYAFNGRAGDGCPTSSIVSISLPDTLTGIGVCAFGETGITSIRLPDGLKTIGKQAFLNCAGLTSISLPDSITTMGAWAFKGTSLTSVRTPAKWTSVTYGTGSDYLTSPFAGCTTLTSVYVPEGATVLPDYAFNGRASDGCPTSGIVSISLPGTLTSIGACAFGETGISYIRLPGGLTTLGKQAFLNCAGLTDITLPDSITTMGAWAFKGTSLTSVRTPKKWTNITYGYGSDYRTSPFAGCTTLKNVEVPEGVTTLPKFAFNGRVGDGCPTTSIENIMLPGTLKTIGASAFEATGIREIVIPASVTTLNANAMANCASLRRIIFLGDVKTIGGSIAGNTALAEVYAPAESSSVHAYFASNYADVNNFSLPASYHSLRWKNTGESIIQDQVIQEGAKLTQPETPVYTDHTFAGWYLDEECTQAWDFEKDTMPGADVVLYARWLYTPAGFSYTISDSGATITGYEGDAINLVLPDEIGGACVTALAAEAIPPTILHLTVSAGMTDIDPRAFVFASGLVSIEVDSANTTFSSDSGVLYKGNTLVCYPQSKASAAFTAPENVDAIGERAFYNCNMIYSLIIPSSVETFGLYSIYNCANLESVVLSSDAVSIADGTFLLCSEDLKVTGPIGAAGLTAYADSAYISYNMYDIVYMEDDAVVGIGTIRAGERIGELPAMESGEKVFMGWSTAEDGSSMWTDSEALMPAADLVLYAIYGYPFEYSQSDSGVTLTKYTGTDTRAVMPKSIDGTPVVEIAAECFGTEGITLVGDKGSLAETFAEAQGLDFEALTYTVTFETNGGTKAAPLTLCATDAVALPASVRTGYELFSWYTNEALTARWTDGDTMPANDLTLYARWKPTEETVASVPFTFDETQDGVIITGFTGTHGKVEIPENINGMEVIGIGEYAFADNPYMQVVTVPASVKRIYESAFAGSALYSIDMPGVEYIDANAFADCVNLAYATLPETLIEIGEYAFQNCTALLNVELPDQITVLTEGLFAGCEWLAEIRLPSLLETVSSGAFRDCSQLESLSFGAAVSEIAADAFDGCRELTAYAMDESNMYYAAADGVLFSKDGTQLMFYPRGKRDADYAVPGGVAAIAAYAMSDSRITALTLNAELTSVGVGALSGSTLLETVVFNETLSTIEANAFDGCANLKEVALPESVAKVGAEAFDMTGLSRIHVPALTELGRNAIPAREGLTIYGCRGSEAEIYAEAHGIRFIDSSEDIEVTEISIPETLDLELYESAALAVTFNPSDTTERTVTWSSGDEAIVWIDENGNVEARAVGTAVITAKAANGSTAECTVTVTKPYVRATDMFVSADEITIAVGDMYPVSATVLPVDADDGAVTWTVKDPSVASWINGSIVGLAEGETVLEVATAGGLTAECSIIVKPAFVPMDEPDFNLPRALTAIESEAFAGLAMTVVSCPEGLKTIGERAFADCVGLAQIYIPSTVTSIASDAFSGCSAGLVIYGETGSAAETFAGEMDYRFASVNG